MPLYDAHCHLQDSRLQNIGSEITHSNTSLSIAERVTNGTSPADWNKVKALSMLPSIRAAYGLHPWQVANRPDNWFELLQKYIAETPSSLIGEIGLDKWIRNPNLPDQVLVFKKQLELSVELQLPPTIHCLKAWGTLSEILREYAPNLPGFLLHSYAGPIEQIGDFIAMGAYFSISGYFAQPTKSQKLETWIKIPIDRMLIETDAPDMLPPVELQKFPLTDNENKAINHPNNIASIYQWVAFFRDVSEVELTQQVEKNYQRIFRLNSA